MFLSPEELETLTKRKRASAQAKVLRAMGIEHKQHPDGTVFVLESHVRHLLGGDTPAKVRKPFVPDFSNINA